MWPLPLLALSGLLVALSIQYLPGNGGHSPSEGFKTGRPALPTERPGIFPAALATLTARVFLDEGFVKSDSEFAGRAVAAWKGLGFQLIIVPHATRSPRLPAPHPA